MSNTSGVYPIDPTTQTGLFRTELGDVVATNITGSTADYEAISDAAIAALLIAYPTSTDVAMSKALSAWANQLIAAAQDIQVDDIKIKTVEKAGLLSDRATALAIASGASDADAAFNVVPLTSANGFSRTWPQGTPRPYGESGF